MKLFPGDLYRHGDHRAWEVGRDDFVALRDALAVLRQTGIDAPFLAFQRERLPPWEEPIAAPFAGELDEPQALPSWRSPVVDPRPARRIGGVIARHLHQGMPDGGMGLLHNLWPEDHWLRGGIGLQDHGDRVFCPQWLAFGRSVSLPFTFHEPGELLAGYDWAYDATARIEATLADWVHDVVEEDDAVDTEVLMRVNTAELARAFRHARDRFRAAVERAQAHGNGLLVFESGMAGHFGRVFR